LNFIVVLGSAYDWMVEQIHDYSHIMNIGCRNINWYGAPRWSTQMCRFEPDLARSVWLDFVGFVPKWSRSHLAVDCFPFPSDSPFLLAVFHDQTIDFLPYTKLVSLLKTLMQTTAGSIPFLFQAFPLACAPQYEQMPCTTWRSGRAWLPTLISRFSRSNTCFIWFHKSSGTSHSVV